MKGKLGFENTSTNLVISSVISAKESSDVSSSSVPAAEDDPPDDAVVCSTLFSFSKTSSCMIFISRRIVDQHFEIFSTSKSSLEVEVVRLIDSGVIAISIRRGTEAPGLRFIPAQPGNPTAT